MHPYNRFVKMYFSMKLFVALSPHIPHNLLLLLHISAKIYTVE